MPKSRAWAMIVVIALSNVSLADQKKSDREMVWVTMKPVQCMDNAWEKDWLSTHKNRVSKYPHLQEQAVMRDFFTKRGVSVLDLRVKPSLQGQVSCMTCDCERGDTLYLRVRTQDLPTMRVYGFDVVSGGKKIN